MRAPLLATLTIGIFVLSATTGCGSGSESASADQQTGGTTAQAPPSNVGTPPEASKTADTLMAQGYEAKNTTAGMMTGKFSVQIGAYKQQENADRVASQAKGRFNLNVYTIPDSASGLVKVYLGDFAAKDEARKFRDEMAIKFPLDYKDAWVSENPSK